MPTTAHRILAVTLLLTAACTPSPAGSSATTAASTGTEPISAGALRTRLLAFADDSMMGRAPGDVGDFKAAEYVAAEFAKAGLEPAGENGGWFQTVPFYRRVVAPDAKLQVGNEVLRLGQDYAPYPSDARYRPIDGATVVYAGLASDSTTWINAKAAKGRVAVFSVTPPEQRDAANRRTPVAALLATARFRESLAIVIAELDAAGPSSVAQMLTGALVTDTTWQNALPVTLISNAAAARIFGQPLSRVAPGTIGTPLRGSARVGVFPLAYAARNVVGILRGSDPALRGTYVSLTAHNDHVGFDQAPVDHDSLRAFDTVVRPLGADSPNRMPTADEQRRIRQILDSLRALRPARQDSIRNGADDDGTGTVALLEIARVLAKGKHPKRSILFVSHTAEEFGLLGSRWYTDHPTVARDSIIGEIDMDMVGRGGVHEVVGGGPAYLEEVGLRRLSTAFGDAIAAANARQPVPFVFNTTFDAPGHPLQYYCRADHYSYARYGIPSVAFSRGEHQDYHQVTDEAQYIDYEAMARVANFVKDAAIDLAALPARPPLDKPKQDPATPCTQ